MQGDYNSAHKDTRFDLWVTAKHAYALNETDPGCVSTCCHMTHTPSSWLQTDRVAVYTVHGMTASTANEELHQLRRQ